MALTRRRFMRYDLGALDAPSVQGFVKLTGGASAPPFYRGRGIRVVPQPSKLVKMSSSLTARSNFPGFPDSLFLGDKPC